MRYIKGDDLKKLSTDLNNHADVTKGMEGKINIINKIAKLGIDTILLNGNKYNRLYRALLGKEIIGTIVQGDNNESN
jgi:isopentenyl phosphate kinase